MRNHEQGLSGPLAAIVSLAAVILIGAGLGIALYAQAHRQARAAADLGAISAIQGVAPGEDPCAVARRVVASNRAELESCDATTGDVRVVVRCRWEIGGATIEVTERARAVDDHV